MPPPAPSGEAPPATAEDYSAHGVITWIPQGYPSFPAAYSGPHSLPPQAHVEQVLQVDAYLGLALWKGASIYLNPEVDEGFGVGNTFGIAGFPNAFAYKLGSRQNHPGTVRVNPRHRQLRAEIGVRG